MTTRDFISVIDKITEIEVIEIRMHVLDFFLKNGPFFNDRFNADVFYSRYCAEMEKKGR